MFDNRVGIIIDYGSSIDLDPFPIIPIGALYTYGTYIVLSSVNQLFEAGVNLVFVASEIGAAYTADAISSGNDLYKKMEFVMLPELEGKGLGNLFKDAIVLAQQTTDSPIFVAASNMISKVKLREVEDFHLAEGRPYATVVAVRGENRTGLAAPSGYRPSTMMVVEKSLCKCAAVEPSGTLTGLLSEAESRGQVRYFPYDGLATEVCNEEDYVHLVT